MRKTLVEGKPPIPRERPGAGRLRVRWTLSVYRKTGQKKFCKVGRELGGILVISSTRWKAKIPYSCGFAGFMVRRNSANSKSMTDKEADILEIFITGFRVGMKIGKDEIQAPSRKPPVDRTA